MTHLGRREGAHSPAAATRSGPEVRGARLPRQRRGSEHWSAALSHDDFLARKHLLGLDGVRGLAAILVVVSHSRDWQVGQIFIGKVGVVAFFVLSGLLITSLLVREQRRHGSVALGAFVLRRFLRILPLYFVTIALFATAVALTESGERRERFFHALPYMATLLPEVPYSWSHDYAGSVTWSIGIEEKFYLLWPLIAFSAALGLRLRLGAATLIAGLSVVLAWAFSFEVYFGYSAIALGCAAALLLHDRSWYGRLSVLLNRPAVLMCSALLWCGSYLVIKVDQLLGLVLVALFSALLLSALVVRGRAPKLLTWAPLVHLGRVSFGVYLLHQLFMAVAEKALPASTPVNNTVVLVIVIPCVTLVATASYKWLETPIRRLAHRRPSPPSVSNSSTPSRRGSSSELSRLQEVERSAARRVERAGG